MTGTLLLMASVCLWAVSGLPPGSGVPSTGARDADPGVRDADPGARGVDSGARDADPGARDADPGARDADQGARDADSGARDTDPGARDADPGAATRAAARAATSEAASRATTDPSIELVTMGPGPELFHRWGHAALCVTHRDSPESDVCYNYGAAFPTSMAVLGWQFLRGTARFMVIRQQYSEMLSLYQGDDRSVWIQRLPFTPAQVKRMMDLLENDLIEENRYYVYHHMWDNCATRLRGHIDTVVGGRLRREGKRGVGVTYRELAQRGLAGRSLLVVGTTLAFGRGLDQEVTAWASMGHPDYLRSEVARQLKAKPEAIYVRQGAPLPDAASAGHSYLVVLAILLALGVVLARRLSGLGPVAARRLLRGLAVFAKLLLVFFGVLLWLTALVTTVRELWLNEALLIFLPTDVLLLRLVGPRLQWYLRLRLAGLVVVGVLLLSGVFVQPLLSALLLPGLICVASLTARLTPRPEGPRPKGPRPEGPRPKGPRPEGPRPEGPRPEGPRAEEKRRQGPWKQRPRKKEPRTGASGGKPAQPSSQKSKKRKRPQAGGPKA